jgi:hypothetical protein
MLYGEVITLWSEIHTKHVNTQCGQNVEFVKIKRVVPTVITRLRIIDIVSSLTDL